MTNHKIDNSLKDYGKVVLWQYDKAIRLLALMKHMHMLYVCAIEQFWKFWIDKVLSIDTANTFGLNLWGNLVGVPPLTILDSDTGEKRFIKPSLYKKVIKGHFSLMKNGSSFEGLLEYANIVFGVDGTNNLTKWLATVSEYGWTTNVDELNFKYQPARAYAEGFVFWYDETGEGLTTNWKCNRAISKTENTSFNDIKQYLTKTELAPTGSESQKTIFLELIDPEGYVRKVTAGAKDALKLELSYQFGDYTITATATRMQKCGVAIVDNGDMSISYVKTPYYDQMHRDQKALFEQKQDEVCQYPLGVKTNEPQETWLFGFDGQQPLAEDEYQANRAYSKGTVVWRIDEEYHGFHWKFTRDVSASENKSFDAIRGSVEKTNEGDPFISGIADTEACDSLHLYVSPYGAEANWDYSPTYNETYLIINPQPNELVNISVSDVPTEFQILSGPSNWLMIEDGYVLPIQMEVWDSNLSALLRDRSVIRHDVGVKDGRPYVNAYTYTYVKPIAYNQGRVRDGIYYRAGTLINLDNEYRYVKEGGTYSKGSFSGTTVMPDRSILKERF